MLPENDARTALSIAERGPMSQIDQTVATPRTVDDYLRLLRGSLEGAPPALIQDALADAEDYMREEVALDAYKPESEIVARIVRNFGMPAEVAAEYRALESRFEQHRASSRGLGSGFLSVILDARTYGSLLYALTALPIGAIYFMWTVAGLIMSASLAVIVIGVPFTVLFIASVRLMALLEGRIVELLLGQRMPRRLPIEDADSHVWTRIKAMLRDRRTWSTMLYMILQLPLGIAYFAIAVTGIALSLSLIAGPLWEIATGEDVIRFGIEVLNIWSTTAIGAGVMILAGVVLIFVTLHVLRTVTTLHARYAEATLVKI